MGNGRKYAFHLMPSAILHKDNIAFIGNGVVLHLPTFFKECRNLDDQGIDYSGRIKISNRTHLLFDIHQTVDGMQEDNLSEKAKIGTTRRGIGPCYASKVSRIGVRVGDLENKEAFSRKLRTLVETLQRTYKVDYDVEKEISNYMTYYEKIKPMIVDGVDYINDAHAEGKRIMVEGANATMLDVDFGTYPYVTSSNASIGGACTGLGLAPTKIQSVVGIVKAYLTRVGAGPFPTELTNEIGEKMRTVGGEFGTTTGRPRRCGWLDAVALRYVAKINGFSCINITKLDVLSALDEIKICVAYKNKRTGEITNIFPDTLEKLEEAEPIYDTYVGWKSDISKARTMKDLPKQAVAYIKKIEELVGVRAKWIGVGQGREAMVVQK